MKRRVAGVSLVLVVGLCAALVALTGSAVAEPPVVVMDSATNPTYTTVEVAGKVNPEGAFVFWTFQVSEDGGVTWYGTNAGGGLEASTLEPVSGTIQEFFGPAGSGALRAGVTYEVRLWAESPGEPAVTSSELEFTTESLPAPTVTINPVGSQTDSTAELSGSITANSPAGEPAAADVKWHFVCSPVCATSNQGTVAAGQSESVHATAAGLEPNTEYTVTLVGENAGPPVSSSPVSFRTSVVPPTAETLSANVLAGGTSTKLRGNVDPNNSQTQYWFEYGPTATYGEIAPAGNHADAGAGRGHVVSQEIDGLTPGTIYHYRVVAEGPAGPSRGGDVEFTTAPSVDQGCPNEAIRRQQYTTGLPECRAYELVSPAVKEGGRVGAPTIRNFNYPDGIRISADGSSAIFTTSTSLHGSTSSAFLYKATRSDLGWTSEEIAPPAPAGEGFLGFSLSNVSSDLSTGLFVEHGALAAAELTTGTESVFLKQLEPGSSVTRLNPGQAPGIGAAEARGQSEDLSHAIFTSNTALTADAPAGASSNLYDYTGGGLHLVSILPDGEPDPVGAQLGTNVPRLFGIGQDFARFNAVSDDGSHIAFTSLSNNQVYQRIDGSRTVEVSASQGGSDPSGAFPAQFVGATATGSKVYFISAAELTPDANTGPHAGKDLYEYDVVGGRLRDLTVDENLGDPAGAGVLGLAGMADDGSILYVVAEGLLAPGASSGENNLYAVRPGGPTTFVGTLDPIEDRQIWEGGYSTSSGASTSASGRYLAFSSVARLTPDAVARHNVYLYDADASAGPQLVCASCGPGDAEGGDALLAGGQSINLETFQPQSVFDDGQLFFISAAPLVEGDTNGRYDVYQYRHGDLRLISSGRGNSSAEFVGATADASDVLVLTASRLLPIDHDEADDIYDVRVDGGFPEPPAPPPCTGEGCRAPAMSPPAAPTPGSTAGKGSNRSSARGSFSIGRISPQAVNRLARTGKLTLHVRTGGGGKLSAKATARFGKRQRQIAHARKTVAKPVATSLILRFSPASRKELADDGRLKVTLEVSFSGVSKPVVRSLTLIAPRHGQKVR